ncbi:hypothetical protein DSO57_1037453 [Entomophthora muscae]|uniref:Uncharacterized protein n=2 Tax=Entomophthora muscae TaxID=34485 RepID=A0ACC2RW24_9FUNG|nr:hypothetical protein DSO57_1016859 [Entomophthora muscae]KAJ9083158.1 hypothetical protein DSO57_1037453 [Entomophthora muscae]
MFPQLVLILSVSLVTAAPFPNNMSDDMTRKLRGSPRLLDFVLNLQITDNTVSAAQIQDPPLLLQTINDINFDARERFPCHHTCKEINHLTTPVKH